MRLRTPDSTSTRRRHLLVVLSSLALALGGLFALGTPAVGTPAHADTTSGTTDSGAPVATAETATTLLNTLLGDLLVDRTQVTKGGKSYWVDNHIQKNLLSSDAIDQLSGTGLLGNSASGGSGGTTPVDGKRHQYLVVWAGDNNVLDKSGADLTTLPKSIGPDLIGQKDLIGPDFFAVVDANQDSPSYGKVVNTATVGPLVENEPHHMQYIWHKGDNIFAGGLFSDVTYVLDTSHLPALSLKAVNLPTDTPCGSVPDAYWVTKDHRAYGTYMGGPDVPGPCRYTDGEVRMGNGFAGSPGELVRLDQDGNTVDEAPATPDTAETEQRCDDIPLLQKPTCANPHGVQAREDLNTLVSSDYNEPRNIILNPVQAPSSYLRRPTVRTWDISDKDHPKLKSVSFLPDGPRVGDVPHHEEPRAAMENTVTNMPGHKGAFVSTMQGGAIFYTPDMTAAHPQWREVFDLTTSNKQVDPSADPYGGGSDIGWTQTSLDDKYLYAAVTGRGASTDHGPITPYILKLDISKLVGAGSSPTCDIDTTPEIAGGGAEPDCPTIKSTLKAPGGPHWGALDNLKLGSDGYFHEVKAGEATDRLAYSNYFVARTGLNGDHRVCMVDDGADGSLVLDQRFKDENTGNTCIEFNRENWPHGAWGPAKPHSMVFAAADSDVR